MLLLFSCLIAVAKNSNILLSKSGERGHIMSFLILEEMHLVSPT
jgi:hypothetical protein